MKITIENTHGQDSFVWGDLIVTLSKYEFDNPNYDPLHYIKVEDKEGTVYLWMRDAIKNRVDGDELPKSRGEEKKESISKVNVTL